MLLLLEKHFITSIDIHLERNCLDKKFLSLKSSGEKKLIKWRPRILPTPLFVSVVSDSVRPYRRQPIRLLCPWDSPGKNTGVGCHFLLQCMKVKSDVQCMKVKSHVRLSDPMDCSPPGSFVHGICQARVLEWAYVLNV